jgi:hypothetical protein
MNKSLKRLRASAEAVGEALPYTQKAYNTDKRLPRGM